MANRENEIERERTFRCGWRIKRRAGDSWPYPAPAVVIQRGEWRAVMPAEAFDAITDEDFTTTMGQLYRDSEFERIQQDLDILAHVLVDQLANDSNPHAGAPQESVGPSPGDLKAALYRWQKAKRDTQEATA